jgi:bla regulator protein BlaR1
MQLLFMKQWLSDSLTRAICWTLIHSLWQGLILAAVAGILVLFTRKSVAAFRYNLLAALFFVFMGVVTFTFVYELNRPGPGTTIAQLTPAVNNEPVIGQLSLPGDRAVEMVQEQDYIARFAGYFNQHASLFVAIWFFIFLAKSVKLMSGLVYIQRIKHHKTHIPAAGWISRVEELAQQLGIKIPVRLLESELVKVPLVAGFLKPVILVPLGLMANLPASQVEAILLHELAHIRRTDFMVNLAQSFAETLFFFNPAVLWLSSLLREEREHCCDDMAIVATRSKTAYIQALVSFQEYQLGDVPAYTMAFPGKKDHLLNRVKRIINNSNKTLDRAEKSFLVLCFSLICILSMVFAQPAPKVDPVKKVTAKKQEFRLPENDALVERWDSTAAGAPDNSIDSTKSDSRDQSMRTIILGEVPADSIDEYLEDLEYKEPYVSTYKPYKPNTPVIASYKDTMPVLRKGNSVLTGTITHNKDGKQYKITIENNLATGLQIDGVKVPDEKLVEYRDLINSIFRQMQADADQSYNTRMKEADANATSLLSESISLQNQQIQLQQQQLSPTHHKLFRADSLRTRGKLELRNRPALKTENKIIDNLVEDLMKNGLITQKDPLTFRLSKDEFTVNGKEPSAEQKRWFREKYVKHPANNYTYSKQGGTVSTTTYVD